MKYRLAIAIGIGLLTGIGIIVTELALGTWRQTAQSPSISTPAPVAIATSTPSPTSSATPIPTPAPTATPVVYPTATTNGFVHLRAGASTSTTDLADLQAGTAVSLTTAKQGLWQPVLYHGIVGYIYTSYLTY